MTTPDERLVHLNRIMLAFETDSDPLEDKGGIILEEEDYDLIAISADAEAVLAGKFRGDFSRFFKAFLTEIARATNNGDDPVEEVKTWLEEEIEAGGDQLRQ